MARLLKITFIASLLCIAGVVIFLGGESSASASPIDDNQDKLAPQLRALVHYESVHTPLKPALRVALAFGYVLAGIAAVLVGVQQRVKYESGTPAHRIRPALVFLVAMLMLIAPYFPLNISEMPLSVRLINELIEDNKPALFVWAISMMFVTAGSGFYILNSLSNFFKEFK